MSAATHSRIIGNIAGALGIAFGDGPCYVLLGDLRVKVNLTGLCTHSDVIVMSGEMELEDEEQVLLNPKVLIEVTSPTTERFDRGRKFHHFQRINSLQEYIIVDQESPHIDRFHRNDTGTWSMKPFIGLDGDFTLASVAFTAPMAKIYRGITFPPSEAETLRLPYQ